MPDEKKTYLINIENNLKKYADEAAEAKKKVDELKVANDDLKKSGKENTAEYQANIAELKNAQKEYKNLQKVVQDQLTLLNKESTYRDKLVASKTIEIQKLKELGSGYIKNAQGLDVINPKYIETTKRIGDINKAIIENDLSMNAGQTNVGRYGESVSQAFAGAGKSILNMVGPMALVTAAIAGAKKIFEGLKEAIMSTTFAIDLVNQAGAVTKQIFYDLAINGQINIANIKNAIEVQKELNALRVKEGFDLLKISQINREEQATRERAIDKTRTHADRLVDLNKVKDLEHQKTLLAVGSLEKEVAAKQKLLAQQPENEILMRNILDLKTKINDTYAQEDQAMKWIEMQRTGFMQEQIDARKSSMDRYYEMMDEIQLINLKGQEKELKDLDFWYEEKYKKAKDNEIELIALNELFAAKRAAINKKYAEEEAKEKSVELKNANKEAEDFINKKLARMDKEAEDKFNEEVEFQRVLFEHRKKEGQAEYDARIKQEEALAEAVLKIREALANSEINLAMSVTNLLSSVAGENKALQNASLIADKAFAIAEVIIQTVKANATIRATAAASVLPGPFYLARLAKAMAATTVPINLNRVAAALDIAAIIAATISGIAANSKSNIPVSGVENAPTSISASAPAQRIFATTAGSTIFTQPQLSQQQLNALPQANLLTADDIARAMSRMPPPVVTVEDINAKTDEVRKVQVRSNI